MKFIVHIITRIGEFFKNSSPLPSLSPIEEGTSVLLQGKINSARNFVSDFFLVLVFVISILTAFFAGRTVKFMENRPAFYFESKDDEQVYYQQILDKEKERLFRQNGGTFGVGSSSNSQRQDKIIVASKGGKKYYYVWCKGAGNIKEKNKRYFADEATAQKAGYTKSASCK
jgi:hypothetical protein